MKKLSDKARLYARSYRQLPYGREIEGTAELLLQMAEKLEEYDDTGHTPEMVIDIARFAKKSHKQAMEYAIQIDGMQHWIPVSERLPEKDTECLIRYYNSKEGKRLTDIAWLDEEGNWQLIREAAGYFPRNFKKEITHWMPMSELYEPVCENP